MVQIIRQDTVWAAGTTVVLSDDIQIAHGATLRIDPGAKVVGNGFHLEVGGKLDVNGSANAYVFIDNWRIDYLYATSVNQPARIDIDHAKIDGGNFLVNAGPVGSFSFTNNIADRMGGGVIANPIQTAIISGNIFRDGQGLGTMLGSSSAIIENNVFVRQSGVYSSYDGTNLIVRGNSFLSPEYVALETAYRGIKTGFDASGNWFGTTDLSVIDGMIVDGNDNLNRQLIDATPILTAPSSLAPLYGTHQNDALAGKSGQNFLYGEQGDDRIVGNLRFDLLDGGDDNDTLDGRAGADLLIGGDGNDKFYVDNLKDRVVEFESGGSDYVLASTSYVLGAEVSVEKLSTTSTTGTVALNLTGNEFAQQILGNQGKNKLVGNGGNDQLFGYGADDTLIGGDGKDTLVGGLGNDIFVFDTPLGTFNVDTIKEFHNVVGDNDTIKLDNAVFQNLLVEGRLSASNFAANAKGVATDANDFVIYNTTNGALSYDTNGNAVGGVVQFAIITGHPTLTVSDFLVI